MPDWLFSCSTITFEKYFWCSSFSPFDSSYSACTCKMCDGQTLLVFFCNSAFWLVDVLLAVYGLIEYRPQELQHYMRTFLVCKSAILHAKWTKNTRKNAWENTSKFSENEFKILHLDCVYLITFFFGWNLGMMNEDLSPSRRTLNVHHILGKNRMIVSLT